MYGKLLFMSGAWKSEFKTLFNISDILTLSEKLSL